MKSTLISSSFSVFALTFLSTTFWLTEGRTTILKTEEDINTHNNEWSFQSDPPFHYFNFTQDIPTHFLPIFTEDIPKGHCVWVLRYMDIFNTSSKPIVNTEEDQLKSTIVYSDSASLIKSVTVTALAFGDVQLDLAFENDDDNISENLGLQNLLAEKVTLFGKTISDNCQPYYLNTDKEKVLRWVSFHVDNIPANKMKLEASIKHPIAFLMVEEIKVDFGNVCTEPGQETNNDVLSVSMEEDASKMNKLTSCDASN